MPPETLLLPEPTVAGQALLFSPEIESQVKVEESKGIYTAERFRAQRPEAYKAVIQLLGADVGLQRIGKLLGIHHLTASAVRDLEPEAIDIVRSKMVTKLRTAVLLQVERLIEHPEAVPMNVSGLIIAQLIDKSELLDGRATQRVERTERVNIYADWPNVVEKLLDPWSVMEIAAPGIGLGAGNVLPIGEPGSYEDPGRQVSDGPAPGSYEDPGRQVSDGPAESAAGAADTDAESVVSSTPAEEKQGEHTTSHTDAVTKTDQSQRCTEADPGTRKQGGAGVSLEEGGAIAPIDSNAPKFSDNCLPPRRDGSLL